MYYIHQVTTTARATILIVDENETPRQTHTLINGSPIVEQSGEPAKNKNGWTCGPIANKIAAERLAVVIAKDYNWDVHIDGKAMRLPYDDISKAAAALGSIKSKRKAKTSAANGRLGGRPKKSKTE